MVAPREDRRPRGGDVRDRRTKRECSIFARNVERRSFPKDRRIASESRRWNDGEMFGRFCCRRHARLLLLSVASR